MACAGRGFQLSIVNCQLSIVNCAQLSFTHTKQFPEIFCRLGTGAKNTKKIVIFRRCLKLAGKAENGGEFIGAKPKKYYIELTQYFVALHRRYVTAEHLHTGCYSL